MLHVVSKLFVAYQTHKQACSHSLATPFIVHRRLQGPEARAEEATEVSLYINIYVYMWGEEENTNNKETVAYRDYFPSADASTWTLE